MDEGLTEVEMAQIAHTFPASGTKAFSDIFLGLEELDYENATGRSRTSMYDVISRGLQSWKESECFVTVGALQEKMQQAVEVNDLDAKTLRVIQQYEADGR